MDESDTSPLASEVATYIFSIYWIFTTLTTVGYGDYSGSTTGEQLISICFMFSGLCFNAVLIYVLSNFFESRYTFRDLLDSRLEEMEIWVKHIEQSYKPHFLPPKLYKRIHTTVRDAFHFDFNLIVEEFQLYQQLTPKMQTELIQLLFKDFIGRFKYFFNSCEVGFRNEFVI